MTIDELRIAALAEFLGCDENDLNADGTRIEFSDREYLVLTDTEAAEACAEYIRENVWAFRPEFIARHTEPQLSRAAQKALGAAQEKLCEGANDLVRALIRNFDAFVLDAIAADGRGQFLSSYDGQERRIRRDHVDLFIYRQ